MKRRFGTATGRAGGLRRIPGDMTLQELRRKIEKRLETDHYVMHYRRKTDQLRVEHPDFDSGVTLSLPDLLNRYDEEGEQVIEEAVYYTEHMLESIGRSAHLAGMEDKLFPVIRSASFPDRTADGRTLLCSDHTAETKIFYALDLGDTFRLVDKDFLRREGVDGQSVVETANFNLRALPIGMKKDVVRNNAFYFINYNDGYDASRILNRHLLNKMKDKARGDLAVAVPHQDVLIFGDLVNPEGYDILAQMMLKFYASGRVPITVLPFLYENGELEPIFILARRRPDFGESKK